MMETLNKSKRQILEQCSAADGYIRRPLTNYV